jgi:diguanylate cyclase (GGDEF)-like protein
MLDLASLFAADGALGKAASPAILWSNDKVMAANPSARRFEGGPEGISAGLSEALKSAASGDLVQDAILTLREIANHSSRTLGFALLAIGEHVLAIGRDLTEERQMRDALADSRARYRDFLGLACDFAWQSDARGRFEFLSGDVPLGHDAAFLLGRDAREFGLSEDEARVFGIEVPTSGRAIWLRDVHDRAMCVEVRGTLIFDPDGSYAGARGICRDVTEREHRESRRAEARQRERSLIRLLRLTRESADPGEMLSRALVTAGQAVGALGADIWLPGQGDDWVRRSSTGRSLEVSGVVLSAQGHDGPLDIEFAGHRVLVVPAKFQGRRNGALAFWRALGRGPWDGDDIALLSEAGDLLASAIAQLSGQEELARLSETDALTGLLNRRGFESGLAGALELAREFAQGGALFFIDFDNFKEINDRCGHAQGDLALKAAGDLLRRHLRPLDLLGRLGGDEFAVWLPGVEGVEAARKGKEIADAAGALQHFAGDSPKRIGFSIGVAQVGARALADGVAMKQVMELADRAMYAVKRAGKGACNVVAA